MASFDGLHPVAEEAVRSFERDADGGLRAPSGALELIEDSLFEITDDVELAWAIDSLVRIAYVADDRAHGGVARLILDVVARFADEIAGASERLSVRADLEVAKREARCRHFLTRSPINALGAGEPVRADSGLVSPVTSIPRRV